MTTDEEAFLSDQSVSLEQLLEQCRHLLIASADDENQRSLALTRGQPQRQNQIQQAESLVSTRGQLKRQSPVTARSSLQRQQNKSKRVTFRQPIDNKTCKRIKLEHSPADKLNQIQLAATDVAPIAYVSATRIQGASPQRSFTVLLDSGSSHTLIKLTSLPFGAVPNKDRAKSTTTTMGSFNSSSNVTLEQVKFPQFGNAIIGNVKADVFNSPNCRYDLIIGRDILLKMGINIDFDTKTTKWMGREIPMASTTSIATDIPRDQYFSLYELEEEEDFELFAELHSDAIIMDRKYQAVSPEEVVQQLNHLNSSQKTQLQTVFEKYKRVFLSLIHI